MADDHDHNEIEPKIGIAHIYNISDE
jgi:hypothetical protein